MGERIFKSGRLAGPERFRLANDRAGALGGRRGERFRCAARIPQRIAELADLRARLIRLVPERLDRVLDADTWRAACRHPLEVGELSRDRFERSLRLRELRAELSGRG